MIYEFQSRATGNVVMTGKVAERMLGIIGKPAGPQGIITVAQLPDAIERVRAAIADERHARREAQTERTIATKNCEGAARAGEPCCLEQCQQSQGSSKCCQRYAQSQRRNRNVQTHRRNASKYPSQTANGLRRRRQR